MALLNEVKRELAGIETDPPIAKMAQVATMLRFGGGLRPVGGKVVIHAQFDSLEATEWLKAAISHHYQREARVNKVSRQTPNGVALRYDLLVDRGATALALQTGLLDRRMHVVVGLPAEVVTGNISQIKAAWRGAFLARGTISDPGKASYLEIICPTHETAVALQGAGRRLGITSQTRKVRSSERVTLRDADAIERILNLMGAPHAAREWTGKRTDGEARGKANRLANFDDANMRRSAKAAAEATQKVLHAFEVLGDDIPENLKAAGDLRVWHPDASLEELGHLANPQITKDAIAGRIRRLLQLAAKTEKERGRAS